MSWVSFVWANLTRRKLRLVFTLLSIILAFLMSIVAGIAGNSGNQTMTLIIRALALGQITLTNVVFLSITLNSLPSGGTMTRKAWGKTMLRISLANAPSEIATMTTWPSLARKQSTG